MNKKALLVGAALLLALTAGCAKSPEQLPSILQTEEDKLQVTQVTRVVDAASIAQLEEYPNLVKADLRGSTCYQAIMDYAAAHPEVQVLYDVALGGPVADNEATTLTLTDGGYDYRTLLENMKYLPNITQLELGKTSLTGDQLKALQETCPGVQVNYSIAFGDQELTGDTKELDLSAITGEEVEKYVDLLSMLPQVETIKLTKADGTSNLTIAQVGQLHDAAPNAMLEYSFELFGKTVSTTDERIEYVEVEIGNEGEPKLREALKILTGCQYFLLDECGLDNEVLAQLRDDFPNTKIVWRIHQYNKGRSWLTDTQVLRAVYGVEDGNSDVFKYCTEVKYMDFGHNTEMVDLSFLAYMPDLEICLLSGSPITDLTPLSNCKKLEFLELSWCGHLTDISPLAQCESLKYLNLGHTRVSDLTVLEGLPLEMLSYVGSGARTDLDKAYWDNIQTMFPDCWITYEPLNDNSASPYGKGWRYTQEGGYTDIYRKVRDVFGYDEIDKILAAQN